MSFLSRLFGPPDVKRLRERGNVDGLIKALSYEDDAKVRRRAAEALGKTVDARAVEPLIAALGDREYAVRLGAAKALGSIGDERAVEPLIAALHNGDEWIPGAAARALAAIGDSRAVEPLIAALAERELVNRAAAAIALGSIGDPRAVEPLIDGLEKRGGAFCAEALGKIGDPSAVPALKKALRDGDEPMRQRAAEALDKLSARALPDAMSALREAEKTMRQDLVEALGQTDATSAARQCAFCGKELHEGTGVRTIGGRRDDPFAAMQQAAQQMLARKAVCSSCGAVFCLECGNAVGVERGTRKTHCPDCGKAVPSSQLM